MTHCEKFVTKLHWESWKPRWGLEIVKMVVSTEGAAITCKNEFEKINEGDLVEISSELRETMISGSSSGPVLEMDWSKHPGISETSVTVDVFKEQQTCDCNSFFVIHGAGSFCHFQVSKSGVHRGLNQPLVKAGFVATRIFVTSPNLEIVRALAREGIPSVAMSPFSCGWSTRERTITSAMFQQWLRSLTSALFQFCTGMWYLMSHWAALY